jgi:hypothetical protein
MWRGHCQKRQGGATLEYPENPACGEAKATTSDRANVSLWRHREGTTNVRAGLRPRRFRPARNHVFGVRTCCRPTWSRTGTSPSNAAGTACSCTTATTRSSAARAYWSICPYFDPRNFYSNTVNVWAEYMPSINLLCLPAQLKADVGPELEPFLGESDEWQAAWQRIRNRARK